MGPNQISEHGMLSPEAYLLESGIRIVGPRIRICLLAAIIACPGPLGCSPPLLSTLVLPTGPEFIARVQSNCLQAFITVKPGRYHRSGKEVLPPSSQRQPSSKHCQPIIFSRFPFPDPGCQTVSWPQNAFSLTHPLILRSTARHTNRQHPSRPARPIPRPQHRHLLWPRRTPSPTTTTKHNT